MRCVFLLALLATGCDLLGARAPGATGPQKLLEQSDELTPKGREAGRREYTVQVAAGDSVVIEAETSAFDPMLEVTPPGGQPIRNDDFQGSRQRSRVTLFVRQAGALKVAVTSPITTATGRFRVTATRTGNVRTDPTTARMPMVEPGQQISGSLAAGDQTLPDGRFTDYLIAMGPTSGSAELRLGAQTSVVPLALVIDPHGRPLQASTAGTYVLNEPAAYRVQLMTPGRGQTATYTLAITTTANDATATTTRRHHTIPGDLRTTELEAGSETQGVLDDTASRLGSGERAVAYTFTAAAAGEYVIELESEVFDPYLIVLGPNGQTWENDDAGGTQNAAVELTAPVAGSYRVVATSYRADMTGKFVLKVQDARRTHANAAVAAAIPATAARGDAPIRGALERGDNTLSSGEFVDRYTRTFTRGAPVSIRATSTTFDTYLIVRSPSGHQSDNDDFASGDTNAGIDIPSAEEGEYTVLVTSYRPGEAGDYTLTMSSSGVSVPSPTNAGGASTPGVAAPVVDPSGGRVFGVFAGITDYPGDGNDLSECANDAIKLSESLERAGLLAAERRVLLTNEQATVGNVRGAMERMAREAGPNDIFVFFYSGHGAQQQNSRDVREIDGIDETIVLYDGHMVDDQLGSLFDALRPRVALLALDSCFAGGFAKDVITRPGRAGFFSSAEDVESSVAGQFQAGGYLSYFMRTGVAGEADASPRDGALTVGELEHFLYRQFGHHAMDVEMQGAFQHLVVDRGAVRSTEVLWRYR